MAPERGRPLAAVSWSGGKDSCQALDRARLRFDVRALVTMFTEDGERSRSHGLRPAILRAQADALGLELVAGRCTWESYEREFKRILRGLRERAFTLVVFGDILLEEHKAWVERVCGECDLEAVEPLWGAPTAVLVEEFLASGGQALIVAVDSGRLGPEWLGRPLDRTLLPELERLGVDPCGENGEYHTLVTSWPSFRSPLRIRSLAHHLQRGYWALDLELEA